MTVLKTKTQKDPRPATPLFGRTYMAWNFLDNALLNQIRVGRHMLGDVTRNTCEDSKVLKSTKARSPISHKSIRLKVALPCKKTRFPQTCRKEPVFGTT